MPSARPLSHKEKTILAIALSWGAGLIDVLGYVTLYHAFVAHMTGNTVSAVLHGVEHNWREVLHRGTPIPAFFLGLLSAEAVLEWSKRRGDRRIAARAMSIEAACLAAFLGLGLSVLGPTPRVTDPSAAQFIALVALIAVAMGVQSAAMRKIGALTIFTTFMTGTLTKLAKDLCDYFFWLHDRTQGRLAQRFGSVLRLSPRQESFQSVILLTAVYFSYATGALCGAFGFHRWGVAIAAAPLTLVVVTVIADLVRPISPVP
ncbi:MAG TPA: YoaK family protein [Tepidisphaeraceae bacterium]|nr:YoaK family protein [Tepidisphaeraceae bacterium]